LADDFLSVSAAVRDWSSRSGSRLPSRQLRSWGSVASARLLCCSITRAAMSERTAWAQVPAVLAS